MCSALLLVLLIPVSSGAQTPLTTSHRRLLGCFGDAFTLVEDVWRAGPLHVHLVADQARLASTAAQKEAVAGLVASAVHVDQEAAFAVARNLENCVDETTASMQPDATTQLLATAVRTELDSALDDAADYAALYAANRAVIQDAIDRSAADPHEDEFSAYDTFGARIRDRLQEIRRKVDALVGAATPRG
jgi:hypothetical protein